MPSPTAYLLSELRFGRLALRDATEGGDARQVAEVEAELAWVLEQLFEGGECGIPMRCSDVRSSLPVSLRWSTEPARDRKRVPLEKLDGRPHEPEQFHDEDWHEQFGRWRVPPESLAAIRAIDWLAWGGDEWRERVTHPPFASVDLGIALDSPLRPSRIGERRRLAADTYVLPQGINLEGMAPGQPTRFEFTHPGQAVELERRRDGWHVVGRQRSGSAAVNVGAAALPVDRDLVHRIRGMVDTDTHRRACDLVIANLDDLVGTAVAREEWRRATVYEFRFCRRIVDVNIVVRDEDVRDLDMDANGDLTPASPDLEESADHGHVQIGVAHALGQHIGERRHIEVVSVASSPRGTLTIDEPGA